MYCKWATLISIFYLYAYKTYNALYTIMKIKKKNNRKNIVQCTLYVTSLDFIIDTMHIRISRVISEYITFTRGSHALVLMNIEFFSVRYNYIFCFIGWGTVY